MNAVKTVFAFAMVILATSAEAATTFDELQAEVAAAASGATVYVENDMEFTSALTIADGKTITLEGKDGVAYRLTRASGYAAGTFFSAYGTASRGLVIRNLVIDFNCPEGTRLTHRGFSVESPNATLTLGSGTKLCNAHQTGGFPGFIVLNKSRMVMEDGAEISNIRNDGWACAILVGNNTDGVFVMNGGLITDCHDVCTATSGTDYGGIVYVYGGRFFFNGGTITGNTSKNFNAGVFLTQGTGSADSGYGVLYVGGHGAITGNVGKVSNDVYCYNGKNNIWIVNNPGGLANSTLYDGATLTVKPSVAETVGTRSKCCSLRSGCDGSFAGIGNISLQDDPMVVCGESFGSATSRYYPTWVKKTAEARTADRLYTRPSLKTLFDLVSGKTATITLFDDTTWESSLYAPGTGTDWLLKSADAADRHTIKLTSTATGFLNLSDQGSTKKVRLENIVIDGNADGGTTLSGNSSGAGGLFYLPGNAVLELGPGAKLCNICSASYGSAIRAISSAKIRLEEGSEISACSGTWGSALLLGKGKQTPHPTVTMTGGRIVDCNCTYTGTGTGMGGAIYLWGATMNMSAGEITNNTSIASSTGAAAIHLENGSSSTLALSGTARIFGNPGGHPDIFKRDGNTISFSGDFRGLVALAANSDATAIEAESGATGAWCFYRSSTDGTCNGKWGYLDGTDVKWGDPVGTVDGYGFVLPSDIDVRLGDAEDLSTLEARKATLPHELTGAALNANITQTLTFDSTELLDSGELPLCLYTGDFTGSVNVITPVEGKLRWRVAKRTVDGVCGLYLERDPYGMTIILR